MDKHPVSKLQEKMTKTNRPLPVYMMEAVGYLFVCTVKVNAFTVIGYGFSKSAAKYEAASKALSRLEDEEAQHSIVVSHGNYIGMLNEVTSQQRLPKPVYRNSVLTINHGFTVECELLGKKTKGFAFVKKQAKQNAARDMLKILQARLPEIIKNMEKIETITEQIGMLDVQLDNQELIVLEEARSVSKPSSSSSPSSDLDGMSTEDMWCELHKHVANPVLQVIRDHPQCILSINIDDDCKTSIVEVGETYEKTQDDLLRKALGILTLVPRLG